MLFNGIYKEKAVKTGFGLRRLFRDDEGVIRSAFAGNGAFVADKPDLIFDSVQLLLIFW